MAQVRHDFVQRVRIDLDHFVVLGQEYGLGAVFDAHFGAGFKHLGMNPAGGGWGFGVFGHHYVSEM